MAHNKSLKDWGTVSQCTHATSSTIQGPYKFSDVAVGIWCHNPQVVALHDGTYALFHIGNGPTKPGATIHTAKSPAGPWTPLTGNTLGRCNNPAPMVAPNGTLYCLCGATIHAAQSIQGPWHSVASVTHSGGPKGTFEYPYLWMDARGNFHVIYHVYETEAYHSQCVNSTVSAHATSADGGKTWRTGPVQPYTTQVQRTDGTTVTVATRERPKIYFDPKTGSEAWLFNGVCGGSACPE